MGWMATADVPERGVYEISPAAGADSWPERIEAAVENLDEAGNGSPGSQLDPHLGRMLEAVVHRAV
jgi:hypothetical protein